MDPRTAVRARLATGIGLGLVTTAADLCFANAHLAGPTLVTAALHAGVAALAAYGVAYRAMERVLPGGPGRALAWAGMLVGALGAAIHAVTGVIVLDRLAAAPRVAIIPSTLPHLPTVLGPLWVLMLALMLAGSAVFSVTVLRGQSRLPRWVGLCSPVALSLALSGLGSLTPWRDEVASMAANAGHLLFFGVLTLHYRRLD